MAFQVDITLRADRHIEETYEWLSSLNPNAANKWFDGLIAAIYSLKDSPRRCP